MRNRLKKAALLTMRKIARHLGFLALYYWSDIALLQFRAVCVMPNCYYRCLYGACMWMIKHRKLGKLANMAIHTIPYHVRFQVA
jgi:hypothetical protein